MNLPIIIVIVLTIYFLTIPIIARYIAYKKHTKVHEFFVHNESVLFIVIGIVLFNSFIKLDGYVEIDMPILLRLFLLLNVVISIYFYFKELKVKNSRAHILNDKDKCNITFIIMLCFGDKIAYNYLTDNQSFKLSKEEWTTFKTENKSKLYKHNLDKFLGFVYKMEKEAIVNKDAKLYSKVIKAEMTYDKNKDNLKIYYRGLLAKNNDELNSEELVIKTMILDNKKLFKGCFD